MKPRDNIYVKTYSTYGSGYLIDIDSLRSTI